MYELIWVYTVKCRMRKCLYACTYYFIKIKVVKEIQSPKLYILQNLPKKGQNVNKPEVHNFVPMYG